MTEGNGGITLANSKNNGVKSRNLIFLTIAIAQFAMYIALSILAPFYPMEASKKGTSTAVSGLVFSVYALAIVLASPLMGSIIGRVGPRNMLMIGVLLAGISNITFGFLHYVEDKYIFTSSCIVVRIFEGIGVAGFSTASFAFIADLFQDRIGTIFGLLEIVTGFGCLIGPTVGGALFDWRGYGCPFYVVGSLILITLPTSFTILPKLSKKEVVGGDGKSSWTLLRIKSILLVAIMAATVAMTTTYRFPVLELHLRKFNLSAKELGLLFLLAPCFLGIFSFIWGYLTDRVRRLWIPMVLGLLFMAVSLLLCGPSKLTGLESTIWTNVISQVLLGVTMALALIPTFKGMLVYAVEGGYPEGISTYGLVGGLWTTFYYLGVIIGPTTGSYLTQHYGFAFCSDVMAGICVIVATVVFISFQYLISPKDKNTTSGSDGRNVIV